MFTGPAGGTLRRSFAARVFNRAVAHAGLPDELTFHGLRHVATSFMGVEDGEHPRVIQHRLGHATARLSMELYAHVPEATDRDVASHLDAGFRIADRLRKRESDGTDTGE
ncbi:MAG: tyrosine-type recombinase/integrase [Acidimicrobiales bacterium]